MAEITATLGHNGGTIQVAVGDTLTVRLPENPTTGYRWQPREVELYVSAIAFIGDAFEALGENALGTGGTRIFRYAARSHGAATLAFVLSRTWEQSAAPRESYALSVEVS